MVCSRCGAPLVNGLKFCRQCGVPLTQTIQTATRAELGTIQHAQKWEYLFISSEHEHGIERPRYINGQELPNWQQGMSIYEYINRLGEEGWELVTAPSQSLMTPISYKLTFKRPKI